MKPIRNVFACLVHENQDCVIDLVHNLRCLDPASTVLLYNGGPHPRLLTHGFPFERYSTVLFPRPQQMVWGRLHDFALDCMRFLIESIPFDTMTIVDSDQLAVRSGYSRHLSSHLHAHGDFGMLVNTPEVQRPGTDVGPAKAAHEEIDLWRPFLGRFAGGEEKFVHWSFWPGTVFSGQAARELVRLFDSDDELPGIVARSRIWASEEVLFPTLVRLLGHDLLRHPVRYDYIRYGARYSQAQIDAAFEDPDAFWIHPVPRHYADPIRRQIRERTVLGPRATEPPRHVPGIGAPIMPLEPTIERMRAVPGWFEPPEARLLATAAAHVLRELPPAALVEVGSYCGRSTVVLGDVLAGSGAAATLYAIDPHEGTVGSLDRLREDGPPTLEAFRRTLAQAGLTGVVRIIVSPSADVSWSEPIILLLIDGLHDYANVARDFLKFEPHLVRGALVAFHDYAPYYPGVQTFVHELLGTARYALAEMAGTLVVLVKLIDLVPCPGEDESDGAVRSPRRAVCSTGVDAATPPLVSCIMPTANRRDFISLAIDCFLRQDYERRELVIIDDGDEPVADLIPADPKIHYERLAHTLSLGAKRNLACERARGSLIAHWDDDDWYASWRLSYQAAILSRTPGVSMCGLSRLLFYDPRAARAWQYTWPGDDAWVYGATLCYRRSFWDRVRFAEISEGEDTLFVQGALPPMVLPLDRDTFYVGIIHSRNTSTKHTGAPGWARCSDELVREVLGERWPFYCGSTKTA